MLFLLAALASATELPEPVRSFHTPRTLGIVGAGLTAGLVPVVILLERRNVHPAGYAVYAAAPTGVLLAGAFSYRRALVKEGVDVRGPAPEIAMGFAGLGVLTVGLAVGGAVAHRPALAISGLAVAMLAWTVSPLVSLLAYPRYRKASRPFEVAVLPVPSPRGAGLALAARF